MRNGNPFLGLFADGLSSAGVEVVDVQNPITLSQNTIDVLHIHWPEQVFWAGGGIYRIIVRLARTLNALWQLKRAGVTIVWMVHNLEPHDMTWLARMLWWGYRNQLCVLSDGFMTLSPGTVKVVRKNVPGLRSKPAKYGWMPAYPATIGPSGARLREELGVGPEDRLFACLGLLRPYKGIETLVATFMGMSDLGDKLLIAGSPSNKKYAQKLRDLASSDHRIHLMASYLSEAEFSECHAAADVIVLPFRSYLHSSSIVHAICKARPVVTPASPFACSLSDEVGPGWVVTYEHGLETRLLEAVRPPPKAPMLDALSPDRLGRAACEFYRELRSGNRSPRG